MASLSEWNYGRVPVEALRFADALDVRDFVFLLPVYGKPGLNNTNPQIPVKTSNPGRNRSKPQLSDHVFASFDRGFSSGELFDRDRYKTSCFLFLWRASPSSWPPSPSGVTAARPSKPYDSLTLWTGSSCVWRAASACLKTWSRNSCSTIRTKWPCSCFLILTCRRV